MTPPNVFQQGSRPVLLAISIAGMSLVCLGASQAIAANNDLVSAQPDNSFLSVRMPGSVEYAQAVRDTAFGDVEHHSASAISGELELSITASVLPGFVSSVSADNMLYRKARRELLDNYSGETEAWSSCSHAGYACRDLGYSIDDGRHGMARLYIDGEVMVVVNAIYEDDEDAARRFLDSVQ